MRKLIWCIIVAWCVVSAQAFGAEAVEQVKSQMSSGNAQVRASAMEQFVRSFDMASQPQQATEGLPIFVGGISDSDAKVREFAVTGLLKIAAGTMRIELPANPNLPDLTTSSQARQALLTAMSDTDPLVRQAAFEAYGLTYKLTPDLEQKIIDEFNSYKPVPGQQDLRISLLGTLVNDRSPSPVAANFIVQKIDDPQFGIAALQSLASLKKPPLDTLPKLLSEVSQHNISESRKSALIQAIQAYGPDAQAQLKQILANPR
jgi:hypothetical protein